jgi:DNA polymerase-3 subunit epsilon
VDFAAIDFETANKDRHSACSVAIAVVAEGKIVDTYHSLIRPANLYFRKDFIAMHGITRQRVQDAPTFREIWPEIQTRCGTGLVAAHNAVFDVGVLTACAEEWTREPLSGRYLCTLALARSLLPGLPNYKLPTLAGLLGIPLDHHDALSDATACAHLAIHLMGLADEGAISQYCRDFHDFGWKAGADTECCDDVVIIPMPNTASRFRSRMASSPPQVRIAPTDGRFRGKRFVFTGELAFLSRDLASQVVAAQGGAPSNSVSKKTDYLVVGEEVYQAYSAGGEITGKLARAVEINDAGGLIQIIGPSEFLRMIR